MFIKIVPGNWLCLSEEDNSNILHSVTQRINSKYVRRVTIKT